MVEGHSRKAIEQIKPLVEEEVSRTPWATLSTITLVRSNFFLFEHLLNKDGEGPVEILNGDKLCQVMDKFIGLS